MRLIFGKWTIFLLDGSKVCIAWPASADWSSLPVFDQNHNLYRLTAQDEVIWQVRRDESKWTKWQACREEAERGNHDDDMMYYSPFLQLWLRYPDGSTNINPTTYQYPKTAHWVEGVTVCCSTYDSMQYELDIETGIATNIKPFGGRRW